MNARTQEALSSYPMFPQHRLRPASELTESVAREFVGSLTMKWLDAKAEQQGGLRFEAECDVATFATNLYIQLRLLGDREAFEATCEALIEHGRKKDIIDSWDLPEIEVDWPPIEFDSHEN